MKKQLCNCYQLGDAASNVVFEFPFSESEYIRKLTLQYELS